ncbi:MAG: aminotransferase class I/II-fold pyridoxal phosphate-dependent enzyme [Candidatus Thermoplasmatota archaeon]
MVLNVKFGSDNHSGVHPDILKAVESVNKGEVVAYGGDPYSQRVVEKFKECFGGDIDVYFVGNGTAANILGLKVVTKSFNSVLCAETAHLNVHECCGPENFIGCKLETIPTENGKLSVELLEPYMVGFGDPHMAQPKVISITQPTELGTVYSFDEIKKLADFSHKNNMFLHIDGARLCNAAVSLDATLSDITYEAGVDILSFGGTKNGMMFGDAVVFFNRDLSENFEYVRKQGMHLFSKSRYIAAQFDALLSDNLWYKNAEYANRMAELLYKKVRNISDLEVTQKVESNAVFASIPKRYIGKLQEKYFFHVFDEQKSVVRWMCSYDTTEEDVLRFVETIEKVVD